MSRLLNLTSRETSSTIAAIESNSDALISSAIGVAENGSFGLGRSLLILGAEELIKGQLLFLKSEGIQVSKIKEVQKAITRYHKERHEAAMLFKLLKLIESLIKAFDSRRTIKSGPAFLNKLTNILLISAKVLEAFENANDDFDWWQKANDFKNNGLYVDFTTELTAPQLVNEEEFKFALSKVTELGNVFRFIKLFLSRVSLVEKMETIKLINEGIEMYLQNEKSRKSH